MSHPEDIVLVRNIHTDCDHFDEEDGYSHSETFMVRWDKMPFKVDVGQVRRFPRYLAEHFAKHLIDHILQKQEDDGNGKMMIRNMKLRENLHNQIFVEVENTFMSDNRSAAEIEAQKIEALNRDFLAKKGALAVDPTALVAKAYRGSSPEGTQAPEPTPAVEVEDVDDALDVPPPPSTTDFSTWSRPDLFREAKERGLKVSIKETNADIIMKLQEDTGGELNTHVVTEIEEA